MSELATQINLMDSSATISAMVQQRNEMHRFRLDMAEYMANNSRNVAENSRNVVENSRNIAENSRKVAENRNSIASNAQNIAALKGRAENLEGKLEGTGTVRIIHSAAVPGGWLPCNGMAIDCGAHRGLCNLVGGHTPDFRGRFPVGFGSSEAPHVGSRGGEAMHTLTVAEMPSHDHGYKETHDGNRNVDLGKYRVDQHFGQSRTSTTGGSQAHNNMPPFHAVQFIIKTWFTSRRKLQGILQQQFFEQTRWKYYYCDFGAH